MKRTRQLMFSKEKATQVNSRFFVARHHYPYALMGRNGYQAFQLRIGEATIQIPESNSATRPSWGRWNDQRREKGRSTKMEAFSITKASKKSQTLRYNNQTSEEDKSRTTSATNQFWGRKYFRAIPQKSDFGTMVHLRYLDNEKKVRSRFFTLLLRTLAQTFSLNRNEHQQKIGRATAHVRYSFFAEKVETMIRKCARRQRSNDPLLSRKTVEYELKGCGSAVRPPGNDLPLFRLMKVVVSRKSKARTGVEFRRFQEENTSRTS